MSHIINNYVSEIPAGAVLKEKDNLYCHCTQLYNKISKQFLDKKQFTHSSTDNIGPETNKI